MSTGIRKWLENIELSQYADAFESNHIDMRLLPELDDQVLRDIGIGSAGHRLRILHAINGTRQRPEAEVHGAAAAERGGAAGISFDETAERRQLTVMFCDLVGFTALSERLDPEDLRELMRTYQRVCGDVIERYEGHVAQYLGDGLMVYFGWPTAHEDDAVRAITAALEVTQAVSQLAHHLPLSVRVGIHTGLVVVGQTGWGDPSIPKAAVGDTPNIASRLQSLAESGSVVVSERTRSLAKGMFDYGDLGAQRLKGIGEPIKLFRVKAARAIESRFDAAQASSPLAPLVGREEEITLLLQRWGQAKDREGQVVLISGEPGIGKSRLTQALRERINNEAHTTLRYQCSPHYVNSPLYPIVEQLRFAAGFSRHDTPEQKLDKMETLLVGSGERISKSLSLFAALLSLPTTRYPTAQTTPQKQKELTLEALVDQVEALVPKAPVLMVFEDVQWIDPTSQEALNLLVSRLRFLPILLLLTFRPDYTPHWNNHAHVTILNLSRLGRDHSIELVRKIAEVKFLPHSLLEKISIQTDGVPLFTEELTKSLLEAGQLREEGSEMQVTPPVLSIPTSLRDLLLARLDRLDSAKRVAQIAACIGRQFSYEMLANICQLSIAKLDRALKALAETGLIYRRGTLPHVIYTFKHALVQEAAYDSLLKSNRQQFHLRIAQILEAPLSGHPDHPPELLAHHYTQSAQITKAIPLWRRAGEQAWARVALREAIAHFQRGLELVHQLGPSVERDEYELSIRELLHAAWASFRGWAVPEVTENAAATVELAKRRGKVDSLLIGLFGLSASAFTQGRIAESLDWAERMLGEGKDAKENDLEILGHRACMYSHFFHGELLEARRHSEQLLAKYRPEHSNRWLQLTGQDMQTSVGVWSSHWTWMLGYPDDAAKIAEETVDQARRVGHVFNLCFALIRSSDVFHYRGELDRLAERIREADTLAREQSIPLIYNMLVPPLVGIAQINNGQFSEGISSLRRGIERWISLGGHLLNPYLKSFIAEAMAFEGDVEGALHVIEECLQQIERQGWEERVHLAEVLRLKGWILARQNRLKEAERELYASLKWARQQQAKSWELRTSITLAQVLARSGKRVSALETLSTVYDWFSQGFATRDLREAKALLEELGY